jgi:hypothetical protein
MHACALGAVLARLNDFRSFSIECGAHITMADESRLWPHSSAHREGRKSALINRLR